MTLMELTDEEVAIIQRVRMTPADRAAEAEAMRQAYIDSLTDDQRAENAAVEAMAPEERQVYCLQKQQEYIDQQLARPELQAVVEKVSAVTASLGRAVAPGE
jgi:hypothetical protein